MVEVRKYLWLMVACLIFLDYSSKIWIYEYHQLETLTVWEGVLAIKYVENHGMSFGFRQGCEPTQVILLLINLGLVCFFAWRIIMGVNNKWLIWGCAIALAGTIGNMVDRWFYGYVIDFIEVGQWIVMNLADVFIILAAVLILVGYLKDRFYYNKGGRWTMKKVRRIAAKIVIGWMWMVTAILLGLWVVELNFDNLIYWFGKPAKIKVAQVVDAESEIFKPAEVKLFKKRKSMAVPELDTSFHTFMSWQAITNPASAQYAFRENWLIDENGLMVYYNPHTQEFEYVIALGQYYTRTVGERFEIEFDNGAKYRFVVGDVKQNAHTDPTNRYRCTGGARVNVVEFLVNTHPKFGAVIPPEVKKMGTLSALPEFDGKVAAIRKLEDSPWLASRRKNQL